MIPFPSMKYKTNAKGRSCRFHFKQKAAAPVLFYTSRVPEKSVMRARHCLCKARGPAARCPLCRSGTAKALFRPSATVDSGCRDFVLFCCAAGTGQAHLCASSSATQGWLTTTQPERQIWASIASPLRIYVSLRKAKEQARFVGGQRKLPRRIL